MSVLNINNKYNIYSGKTNNTVPVNSFGSLTTNKRANLQTLSEDKFTYTAQNSSLRKSFNDAKAKQGLIEKAWDGFKNLFHMKSGSSKVEEMIKKAEKGEISQEEAQKAIDKYAAGQKMSLDVAADMASGILAVAAFALAVPTGGASLAIGLGAATAVGAGAKIAIKGGDALITGKEYKAKDLLYDTATGAVNGIMAPVTNGIGASLTKTVGTKLGLTVVESSAKEIAGEGIKQAAKSVILTQGVDVAGGTIGKRALALGIGMAADGALSGASDNMIRAALNGEDVVKAGAQGFVGGAIAAPIIGGGFRVASKAGRALNNKITTKINLPDGVNTKFKQGQVGDCALLSTIDGMMSNPETADIIRKSITKSAGGDYNVKIGDTIVRVSKDAISDEMLSDVSGIKIFEQAYKQIAGDIDGGFAEVVAKQFGLNPVHITSDALTDEVLDRLASEQGNAVLSLGTLVDADGAITSSVGQRHYFTVKNIDSKTRTVSVTSTMDTSKVIHLSYDDVKTLGISIDGGTVTKTNLPNIARNFDDELFKGIDVASAKKSFLDNFGHAETEIDGILSKFNGNISTDTIAAELELHGISPKEAAEFLMAHLDGGSIDENGAKAFNDLLQAIQLKAECKNSSLFDAFNLSLHETDTLRQLIKNGDTEGIYDLLLAKDGELALTLADNSFFESSYKELTDLIDGSVYKHVSPDDVASLGIINGRERFAVLPDAATVVKKSIPKSQEERVMADLIKSNMVTEDMIDIVIDNNLLDILPQVRTTKIAGGSSLIGFDMNISDIISKAKLNGIDSLSSHEIHLLTDSFSELYSGKNANSQFQKLVNSLMKTKSSQYNNIYSYIEHLKKLSAPVLKKYGVEIEDHAFMRMLDRNMLSVMDNKKFRRLGFSEFIELIAQNAKAGNKKITGYNSVSGIKMLTRESGGKVIIDSVM